MSDRPPRICMMTPRGLLRNAFRCSNYEAQDVLGEIDDVDLIQLRPRSFWMARRELHKRLVWHDFTRRVVSMNLAFQPTRLTRDYDAFIAYLPLTQDLVHLPAIEAWKERSRTSICWIEEIWAADLPRLKPWLAALDSFDHIATCFAGTAEPLSQALGRPCHFVPAGVDAVRFSPLPQPPARAIDILSIGRRRPEVHRACSELARDKGWFYIHDTFNGSYVEIEDHRLHRNMLAQTIKRSRFFVVAPAKDGSEEGSRGQVEVGLRYYEAAAAGAVMVGQTPRCDAFRSLFDWQETVFDFRPDGSDVLELLSSLRDDEQRLAEVSRRNAVQALLRHDWVYRWEKILEIVGLKPTEALLQRKARLLGLAEMGSGERASRTEPGAAIRTKLSANGEPLVGVKV